MFHLGWSTMLVLAVGVQLSLKTIHYIWVTASACTEVSAKNGKMTNHTKSFNLGWPLLLFLECLNPAHSPFIAETTVWDHTFCPFLYSKFCSLTSVQNTESYKLYFALHTHIQICPYTVYMYVDAGGRWVFKINVFLNYSSCFFKITGKLFFMHKQRYTLGVHLPP